MRIKRARAHAAVVATVAAWAFVVAAVTTGLVGYLVVASQDGVREALRTAPPAEAAVQVVTRLAPDPADQDAAVREVVAERSGGAPLAAYRSLAGGEDALAVPGSDQDARGVLTVYEGLEEHAELVDGGWPVDGGRVTQAALHATAAEALGLAVGDQITVGETLVRVTGTWLPADPDDPFWFGEPIEVTGVDGSAYGPFVVTEEALSAVEPSPRVRWRVTPQADAITPGQVAALAGALPGLPGALEGDDRVDVRGVAVSGELAATAGSLDADVSRGTSVSAVPLVVLVAVAIVTGAQVARLLGVVREVETTLLRSRGLSAGQLVWWSVLESVAVVVPAAALGAAATVAALRAAGGPAVDTGVAAWCAAGVAAGTLALLVAGAAATARRRVEDTVAFSSRRATGAIGWSFAAVALIAAAVAIWQLRRYGEASGTGGADLLATPGPALALLACAALALLAVPFPLALAERALAGRRRLGLLLPAWQVTRRLPVYASVVVLVVVTAGAGVLAASYSATWTGLQEDLADVRSGADVRVTFDRAGPLTAARPAESALPYGQVDGAAEAVGVLSTGARIGDESTALLAMPAAGLGAVVEGRDDVFPADRVAAEVAPAEPPLAGLELPEGTERLEVDATGVSAATLLVADAGGVLAQAVVEDGVAAVPAGFGTVVAADLTLAVAGESEPAVTAVRAVDASGTATDVPLDGAGAWQPQAEASYRVDAAEPGTASPLSAAAVAFQPGATVRLTPPAAAGDPVPVVASRDALDHFGLQVGDPVTLHVVGARIDASVVDEVPVVPGVAEPVAFVADLPSVTAALLRVADRPQRITEVWLSAGGGDTAALAAAVEDAGLASAADVTDRETVRSGLLDHGLARHVVPAFWSVAAAAVVLTAIGAVASAATLRRQRRGELAVLRVVGVAPSEQARSRRIEQAGMGLLAMVAGALGGVVVAALTVTVLARAATSGVPQALDPVGGASLGALALFGVALAGVVAAVALLQASRAGRDAAAAVPGEERR